MKKVSTVINLITNPETLAAVHTHTHTCSFTCKTVGAGFHACPSTEEYTKNAIVAFINNANKDEKF